MILRSRWEHCIALGASALLLLSFATPVNAQLSAPVDDPLIIRLTPERPSAYTRVTAELQSFSTDLSRSDIVWSIDGDERATGKGRRFFDLVTKGFGVPLTLTVTVTSEDGRVFEKSVNLEPAGVELLWQADSYTPPFYKGKALFPYEGRGSIVAIALFKDPEGRYLPPSELVYTWKKDGDAIPNASGAGRNRLEVESRIPIRPAVYSAVVESIDRRLAAERDVVLSPIAPQIHIYENHPLLGIRFNAAKTEEALIDTELTLSGIPYFFTVAKRRSNDIDYDWQINYKSVEQQYGSDLTLQRQDDAGGTARVSLRATVPARSLQTVERSLFIRSISPYNAFIDLESGQ